MRKAIDPITEELVHLRGIAWQEGLNTLAAEERAERAEAVVAAAVKWRETRFPGQVADAFKIYAEEMALCRAIEAYAAQKSQPDGPATP